MDKYVIEGGKPLNGSIQTMRSKNATLPILAAALLPKSGTSVLKHVPELRDIDIMLQVLRELGAEVSWDKKSKTVSINAANLNKEEAPYDLVRKMRASFLVLGSLISRLGRARVSLPGGCSLGQRPVDLHLKGFSQLGITISEESGYVIANGRVQSGEVYFDRPSHTGTENIMIGAAISKGETRIINAACDPEVVDVANFLNKMGADIRGAGATIITIHGVDSLNAVTYEPMPDRLESGTFLCMAAGTGGVLTVNDAIADDLELVILKLREMGCELDISDRSITLHSDGKLRATDFVTFPFPGFPTDLQACFVALSTQAQGISHMRETVFDDRFSHCMELMRLGAKIAIHGDVATIEGVPRLNGATVMASDIRAGAGLVTACLIAEGTSEVRRIYHIERGYDALDDRLRAVGAVINKIPE
ncbi:MAG: UDP-N-acetylglucosamine 1-carboxyvinyltransferase [Candidatus Zixiibacteriota bacterium]